MSPQEMARRSRGGVLLCFIGDVQALRAWVGLGIARLLQQNAALVEESAAAAESLKGKAGTLLQLVSGFKLTHHEALQAPTAADPANDRVATERCSPARAHNVTRPAFSKKASASKASAQPVKAPEASRQAEPALQKTGTDDEWASF